MMKSPLFVFFKKLYRHLLRKLIREACGFTLQNWPDEEDERSRRAPGADDDEDRRVASAIDIQPTTGRRTSAKQGG